MICRHIRVLFLALLTVLGFGVLAPGLVAEEVEIGQDVPMLLVRSLIQTRTHEQFIYVVLNPLRTADLDGNGLDAGDIEIHQADKEAAVRANVVRGILMHDLDGDGRVTPSEVERSNRYKLKVSSTGEVEPNIAKRIERNVNQVMIADANSDGAVTLDEMVAHASQNQVRLDRMVGELSALLELDPNEDGRLTADELLLQAEAVFQRYDLDNNGQLSTAELRPLQQFVQSQPTAKTLAATCTLPKASADDQVVVFGVHGGEGLSTATVAGMDEPTSTARVVIDKGAKPLYILLSSVDAMIWRFEGHTERISRIVAVSRRGREGPGVGFTGIDRKQVSFEQSGNCIGAFHDPESGKALQTRAVIEKYFGRSVDVLAGTYGVWAVRFPSGQTAPPLRYDESPPEGVPSHLWQEHLRFSPGGVVDIDAETVISARAAEPYDVLPQQAGLVQLVQSGSIRVLSDGVFHIVKPIKRFPARLTGAHSVKFMLGKGVPMPSGDPGHSCVISEEDGSELLNARICR